MNAILRTALAVAGLAISAQAAAQVTFYESEGFEGQSFTTKKPIGNFERYGFNDRALSVVVVSDRWEVCDEAGFSGQCVVLRPGRYSSLEELGLSGPISSVRLVNRNARIANSRYAPARVAAPAFDAPVSVTFYEGERFQGRSFNTTEQIANFERQGFNNRSSSVVIIRDQWEICEDARFSGRCVVLGPGRYPSLAAMGFNDGVTSVRIVNDNARDNARIENNRYAPAPVAAYDYRAYDYNQRSNERLYEAQVTSVRAVVGSAEQRCWVEREEIAQDRTNANVPAAIAGALIGGILGHQIGGGRGRDAATVAGAVGGAALGANVGRDGSGQQVTSQDVRRCASTPSQAQPAYWDVIYSFRGQEHRMQMSVPPGSTVTVNEQGEPRA